MSLRLVRPGLAVLGTDPKYPWWLTGGLPVARFPHEGDDGGDDGTGGDGSSDEDDDDDADDDDDDDKSKKDDKDDEDKPSRPERQAAKYRTQLRAEQKKNAELEARLRALEDKDKPKDEVAARNLKEAQDKVERLTAINRELRVQNAFLMSNTIEWHDPEDAFKLIDLSEVDVDEDGTVDAKALRAALKDLAKRKPHLVKKSNTRQRQDDDDDEDGESDEDTNDQGSKSSGSAMRGKRKGEPKKADRAALAKRFPALRM